MSREASARKGSFLMVRPESPALSPAIFQSWVVLRPQCSPWSDRRLTGISPIIPSPFSSSIRLASGITVADFMNRMVILKTKKDVLLTSVADPVLFCPWIWDPDPG